MRGIWCRWSEGLGDICWRVGMIGAVTSDTCLDSEVELVRGVLDLMGRILEVGIS